MRSYLGASCHGHARLLKRIFRTWPISTCLTQCYGAIATCACMQMISDGAGSGAQLSDAAKRSSLGGPEHVDTASAGVDARSKERVCLKTSKTPRPVGTPPACPRCEAGPQFTGFWCASTAVHTPALSRSLRKRKRSHFSLTRAPGAATTTMGIPINQNTTARHVKRYVLGDCPRRRILFKLEIAFANLSSLNSARLRC
jgi:hypothetical protein